MLRKPADTVQARIKSAREELGLSQSELARRMGVTRGAVGLWETTGQISSENIRKLAIDLGVNTEWLETGRGRQSIEEPRRVTLDELERNDEPFDETSKRPSGILEIDVRAGLGGGGYTADYEVRLDGDHADPVKSEGWQFPTRFMREEVRAPENRIIILETEGDSMTPTILSGDRVIVDTGHRIPSPDGIYALRDRYGAIIVKRLQVLRKGEPPQIRIISDNKSHDPEDVGADEIQIVGRVLWVLKRL